MRGAGSRGEKWEMGAGLSAKELKVGDWDQGFGDQAPCSGVRVLLGEKEESSARG